MNTTIINDIYNDLERKLSFKKFCMEKNAIENFYFVNDIIKYKSIKNDTERSLEYLRIRQEYFDIGHSYDLNINDMSIINILNSNTITNTTFDKVFNEINSILWFLAMEYMKKKNEQIQKKEKEKEKKGIFHNIIDKIKNHQSKVLKTRSLYQYNKKEKLEKNIGTTSLCKLDESFVLKLKI